MRPGHSPRRRGHLEQSAGDAAERCPADARAAAPAPATGGGGLPDSTAPSIVRLRLTLPRGHRRALDVTFGLDEIARVRAALFVRSKLVVVRDVSGRVGPNRLRLTLPRRSARHVATLELTVRDASGNLRVVRRAGPAPMRAVLDSRWRRVRILRMRRATLLLCAALSLMAVQAANAGKGPFQYRHVGHIGAAVTPDGIAIDQQCGDVYIADPGAQVVHHYNQFGKLLNNIGIPGSQARGGLQQPTGIFVANAVVQPLNALGPPMPCTGEGILWVTDYSESRISVFKPDGTLLEIWCGKTTFPAGVCDLVGDYDYFPHDVWVEDDRVWVAGRFGNSIKEYTLSGALVRSVGTGAGYSAQALDRVAEPTGHPRPGRLQPRRCGRSS